MYCEMFCKGQPFRLFGLPLQTRFAVDRLKYRSWVTSIPHWEGKGVVHHIPDAANGIPESTTDEVMAVSVSYTSRFASSSVIKCLQQSKYNETLTDSGYLFLWKVRVNRRHDRGCVHGRHNFHFSTYSQKPGGSFRGGVDKKQAEITARKVWRNSMHFTNTKVWVSIGVKALLY
jgi:hypothetical protein